MKGEAEVTLEEADGKPVIVIRISNLLDTESQDMTRVMLADISLRPPFEYLAEGIPIRPKLQVKCWVDYPPALLHRIRYNRLIAKQKPSPNDPLHSEELRVHN